MYPILALCAWLVAQSASAQSVDPLPPRLAGRWTLTSPSGVFLDTFEIQFEGDRAGPKVRGTLNWNGVSCGAKDAPVEASWNGAELYWETVLQPDANTQRTHGRCANEPARFTLKRKSGSASFEGDARVGSLVATMTASPQ